MSKMNEILFLELKSWICANIEIKVKEITSEFHEDKGWLQALLLSSSLTQVPSFLGLC